MRSYLSRRPSRSCWDAGSRALSSGSSSRAQTGLTLCGASGLSSFALRTSIMPCAASTATIVRTCGATSITNKPVPQPISRTSKPSSFADSPISCSRGKRALMASKAAFEAWWTSGLLSHAAASALKRSLPLPCGSEDAVAISGKREFVVTRKHFEVFLSGEPERYQHHVIYEWRPRSATFKRQRRLPGTLGPINPDSRAWPVLLFTSQFVLAQCAAGSLEKNNE
jgi:hypothetical protein